MPTAFGGRRTSDNIRSFNEKIQKALYRGGVRAATNWETQDSFGIIKKEMEDLKKSCLFFRENSEFFGGNLLSLRDSQR